MRVPEFDNARDLQISRVIKAPREEVWGAWSDRTSFERWWVPAPSKCKVQEMDLRPGGAFIRFTTWVQAREARHDADRIGHTYI